jgi:hypothetical protein
VSLGKFAGLVALNGGLGAVFVSRGEVTGEGGRVDLRASSLPAGPISAANAAREVDQKQD